MSMHHRIEGESGSDFRSLPPPYPTYPSYERFEVVSRRDPKGATAWLDRLHEQRKTFADYARRMRETHQTPIARMILFESAGRRTAGNWIFECLPDGKTFPEYLGRWQEADVKQHLERDHYLNYPETVKLINELREGLLTFREEAKLAAETAGWQQKFRLWWTGVPLLTRDIAVQRLEKQEQMTRNLA